jgi:hypothetical protein
MKSPQIFILLGLSMVFVFLVAAKYDYLLETGDKTVKSSECNECHKLIYEEWSKDFHAKACINQPFRKSSKNYEVEECIGCYAAQDIRDEKNLKVRPVYKEEGINCTSCHLKNNMIYAPYLSPNTRLSRMIPCSNLNSVQDAICQPTKNGRQVAPKRPAKTVTCREWSAKPFRDSCSPQWYRREWWANIFRVLRNS